MKVILQRVREAERNIIYNEFSAYEKDILQGIVERQDNRYIYVNLGKIEAVLSKQDQMPNEFYQPHDRIKVFVSRVENTSKGPQVFVSRSHPDLLRRLFEQEVPEVYDGTVEIVSIAREAGDRAKVAVRSFDANVDPVGTCVGPKGQRVQAIVNELKGENMDIVEWNEDPARLAAKLTGFKIDIKSETDMEEFYAKLDEGDYIDEYDATASEAAEESSTEATESAETVDEAILSSDMTADDYENVEFDEK